MTIIGGIVGALFITGVFLWQEMVKFDKINELLKATSTIKEVEDKTTEAEPYGANQEFEDKIVEMRESMGEDDFKSSLAMMLTCYLDEDFSYFDELSEGMVELYRLGDQREDILSWAQVFPCESFFENEKNVEFLEYLLNTDKDSDGLNLYLELIHSGDDNNKDTDGDGYDDFYEAINKTALDIRNPSSSRY